MTYILAADQRRSGRGRGEGRKQWRMQPVLLALEERALLSTFTVTNPTDTPVAGEIDLRQAIADANTTAGANTINFSSAVFSAPQTITLGGTELELSNTTGLQTITGPAAGVTVSGGGTSRVLLTDGGVTASLSGMTITGGDSAGFSYGGGLENLGATTLTNCTVSGNSASVGGGVDTGTYLYKGATTALINCTVSGNSAESGGGTFTDSYFGSTATLTNTIVAGNIGLFNADVYGAVSGNNNLIGTGGSGGLSNGVDGNIVGVANPGLAPLGNYGGTARTMALLPGSPAINAGTSGPTIPTTDERGLGRVGAADIGAFESQGFTDAAVPGSTPQTSNIGTAFANPLAVTVTANNAVEPVDGGVVSFVAEPALDGATALLTAPSAAIASGQASVTAAPNNVDGSYTVVASAAGLSAVSYALTNTGPVFTSLVVNTTSDSFAPGPGLLSLREAVGFNDTSPFANLPITFDSKVFKAPQAIALTGGQLELSNANGPETITGPAAGVTVSGGGLSRVFQIDANVTASLTGLTISGGIAVNGGGIYNNGGTTTLLDCIVSGNTARYGGGGLDSNAGTTMLTHVTIIGNSASEGGGLAIYGGTTTLNNVTVGGNLAGVGGGVANHGSLTVDDSNFEANLASAFGGALYNERGHIDLLDSSFTGNSAGATGGGISNSYMGSGSISGCSFLGNHAGGTGGGAISVYEGSLTIGNTSMVSNSAPGFFGGGGLLAVYGSATLTSCTVSGNTATNGGGVFNYYDGTVTLSNCTVSGNSATGRGGGIANEGTLNVTFSRINNNTATSAGGGISTTGGSATITTSQINSNQVNSSGTALGGGIECENSSLTLTYSTASSNQVNGTDAYGGGIYALNSTADVEFCAVNSNQANGSVIGEGGGIYAFDTTLTLVGTAVKGNKATTAYNNIYNGP